jgi:hypothetical protein
MKKSALLVGIAGLAVSGAAFGQVITDDTPVTQHGIGLLHKNPANPAFSSRVLAHVYGPSTQPTADFRGWNGAGTLPQRAGDDIDFSPGAGANGSDGVGGPLTLTGAYFAVVAVADGTVDFAISVYDVFGGWTTGTFPGTTFIDGIIFTGFAVDGGFVNFFSPATGPAGIPDFGAGNEFPVAVGAGTDAFGLVEILTAGTTDLHPTDWVPATANLPTAGSTDSQRWGDTNDDELITGAPGGEEINVGGSGNRRAVYFGFEGDAPLQPPVAEAWNATGCLLNGTSTRTAAIPAGGIKWFRVCLSQSADDELFRYVDIDTEGSTTDVDIALYGADGNLIGVNGIDRGSGNNAMISTGVGRRAGVVDGDQFDGWAGDMDAAGDYYVAVGNQGSTFGGAFSAAGAGAAGSTPVNINTNYLTSTNDPSVIPVLNGTDYNILGTGTSLIPGDNFGTAYDLDANTVNSVRWSIFTIDNAVCASGGSLVFDFETLSTPIADIVAWVFDANGNIVGFGDDGLGTPPNVNKPDISFGAGGNSGDLAAGTYYLAVALFDADNSDLQAVAGDDRFHVRGRSASGLDGGANINYTPGAGTTCGPTVVCDSIDFNNDTSFFDPTDIDAFLSAFSEGPCIPETATCNDIDFNNDTSLFDPCDIDSFLLQFSEGPCTICGE